MENTKKAMMDEAREKAMTKYNTSVIYPVGKKESFDECFTHDQELNILIFWYDMQIDCGRTTGIVTRPFAS